MIEGQTVRKLWVGDTATYTLKQQLAQIEQQLGQAQAHLVQIEHDLDLAPRRRGIWRTRLNPWHRDFSFAAYAGVLAAGMLLAFGVQCVLWAAGLI